MAIPQHEVFFQGRFKQEKNKSSRVLDPVTRCSESVLASASPITIRHSCNVSKTGELQSGFNFDRRKKFGIEFKCREQKGASLSGCFVSISKMLATFYFTHENQACWVCLLNLKKYSLIYTPVTKNSLLNKYLLLSWNHSNSVHYYTLQITNKVVQLFNKDFSSCFLFLP